MMPRTLPSLRTAHRLGAPVGSAAQARPGRDVRRRRDREAGGDRGQRRSPATATRGRRAAVRCAARSARSSTCAAKPPNVVSAPQKPTPTRASDHGRGAGPRRRDADEHAEDGRADHVDQPRCPTGQRRAEPPLDGEAHRRADGRAERDERGRSAGVTGPRPIAGRTAPARRPQRRARARAARARRRAARDSTTYADAAAALPASTMLDGLDRERRERREPAEHAAGEQRSGQAGAPRVRAASSRACRASTQSSSTPSARQPSRLVTKVAHGQAPRSSCGTATEIAVARERTDHAADGDGERARRRRTVAASRGGGYPSGVAPQERRRPRAARNTATHTAKTPSAAHATGGLSTTNVGIRRRLGSPSVIQRVAVLHGRMSASQRGPVAEQRRRMLLDDEAR